MNIFQYNPIQYNNLDLFSKSSSHVLTLIDTVCLCFVWIFDQNVGLKKRKEM